MLSIVKAFYTVMSVILNVVMELGLTSVNLYVGNLRTLIIHTIETPPPPQAVFTHWQNRAKLVGFKNGKYFFCSLKPTS